MEKQIQDPPKGLKYPFRVSSKGGISKTGGGGKVSSNLIALAKSSLNERLIRKGVGTVGYKLLFQTDINSNAKAIESLVFEAITKFEPRAIAVQVKVRAADSGSTHMGIIEVSYVFKNTGDRVAFSVNV